MRRVILYKYEPAWAGGFILSPPVCFPTQLFKDAEITFEHYNPDEKYSDKDIFYFNWGEYLTENIKEKFKDNLCIIGGSEAYSTQFKDAHIDDPNKLFLYSSVKPNVNPVDAFLYPIPNNIIFIEKYWWYTTYFCSVDADYRCNNEINFNLPKLTKKFLMQIRTVENRYWRLEFYGALIDHINDSLVSRVDIGKSLDSHKLKDPYNLDILMKANPLWYSSTHFSIILETYIDDNFPIFITEKTFKPLANKHPFMLVANKGSLQKVKSWGFESFENLFDESYDRISNDLGYNVEKIKIIKKNVDMFDYSKSYDSLTLEKIEHNRNLFYNRKEMMNNYIREIVVPISDWINSK